jgi:hypothetical protein
MFLLHFSDTFIVGDHFVHVQSLPLLFIGSGWGDAISCVHAKNVFAHQGHVQGPLSSAPAEGRM